MNKQVKRAFSYFPTKLPVGMTEFHAWADSIIELAGPYADPDSMKYAIASALIHLPATRSAIPKNYFVGTLRKAAANQVASQVFQDIKTKQQEAAKAAQAEDTAAKEKAASTNESAQKT